MNLIVQGNAKNAFAVGRRIKMEFLLCAYCFKNNKNVSKNHDGTRIYAFFRHFGAVFVVQNRLISSISAVKLFLKLILVPLYSVGLASNNKMSKNVSKYQVLLYYFR